MSDPTRNAINNLAHLIEAVSAAVIGVDRDRIVTLWNRGAERLFAREKDAMIGHALVAAVEPPHRSEIDRCLSVALHGETARGSIAARLRDRDAGERIPLSAFPMRDSTGAVEGAALVSLDTGENMRGTAGLETLVQGIAHRFNNINSSIQGLLELVVMDPSISSATRERVDHALGDLHRSTAITHRLLLIGSGSPTPPESLHLHEALRTLLPFVERDLRSRGVRLDVRVADTPPVFASPWQINLLLNALVDNAADATIGCTDRTVFVASYPRKDGVLLGVADTGCGIPVDDLAQIFTPFFTTKGEFAPPGSPQASARGVGLSLALCHRIVRDMGAHIEVESTLGKGSCFRLIFPVY